ncbi:MAG: hypothetical protein HRT72_00625 [Flavobacteriales bacterium]|nr:hypothetical protein [Flavobacteriales bacterium]
MEALLVLIYSALFIYLINKWSFFIDNSLSRKSISIIFSAKVLFGVLMSLIYTYHYTDRSTADIYKYFDDAKVMYSAVFTNPQAFLSMLTGIGNDAPQFHEYYDKMNHWFREYESSLYNDNHTLIRFNAIVYFASFGYYNVHTVFMCFCSLIGSMAIYKTFSSYLNNSSTGLMIAIFLIPSVIFWNSGVLKEGLLFLGLGLMVLSTNKLLNDKIHTRSISLLLFSLLLMAHLKYYILIAIIPSLFAYCWVYKSNSNILLKYSISFVVIITLGLNAHHILPNYNIVDLLIRKQLDFVGLVEHQNSGSKIDLGNIPPTLMGLISNIPQALKNTLIWSNDFTIRSPFVLLAIIENFAIIGLIGICVVFRKPWKNVNLNLFLFCILFSLTLYTLIGLVTPVMGAIMRYKIPGLPFLIISMLLLLDKEKLIRKFSFFKYFI